MFTMYDTIMDLPLLKGISFEDVSAFVEKTSIEFVNYKPGETIYSFGEECSYLLFIIKGKVEIIDFISEYKCEIRQCVGKESVPGADNLFGIHPFFVNSAVAKTAVSILKINKLQYIKLLQTNTICLYNYVNYLARKAQKSRELLLERCTSPFKTLLKKWIDTVCDYYSKDIRIEIDFDRLVEALRITKEELNDEISSMKRENLIATDGNILSINSRKDFSIS